MKIHKFLLNITICLSAFFFGSALVGIYQVLFVKTLVNEVNIAINSQLKTTEPSIEISKSVLLNDVEETNLSNLKENKSKPDVFDPEGRYFFFEESKGFKDFLLISIRNKNFDVDYDDKDFGKIIPPKGFIVLEDTDNGAVDDCEMHDYLDIPNIKIENSKISFVSEKKKGITYEFKGEFLVSQNFSSLDSGTKVLSGKLTKKKNGKTIANEDLTFGWFSNEQCIH